MTNQRSGAQILNIQEGKEMNEYFFWNIEQMNSNHFPSFYLFSSVFSYCFLNQISHIRHCMISKYDKLLLVPWETTLLFQQINIF